MDPSSIPKQYGGELDWRWGEMPNLDEPTRERLQGLEQEPSEGKTKKELLKGPMLFQGDRIEVLGTENGKQRRMTIPVPASEQQPQPQPEAETQINRTPSGDPDKATTELNSNGHVAAPKPAAQADEIEKTARETVAVNIDQGSGYQDTVAAA